MNWFSRRWAPRWELESLVQANRTIQDERDLLRCRQEGYDVLCGLMNHIGIVDVRESASGDGHLTYLVEYEGGAIKPMGAELKGRWPSV